MKRRQRGFAGQGRISFAKQIAYPLLAALALVLGYLGILALWTDSLEFRDVVFPRGFRELLTERQVSRFDPLLAVGQGTPLARSGIAIDVCEELFRDPSSPAFGSEDSDVRIVTFFDYRCPYCRVLTKLITEIRGRSSVRVIYKEWPILGEASELAARAALAADGQGKYVEFHTRLMDSAFIPTPSYIESLAADLNLNQAELLKDMKAARITAEIQRTMGLASQLGFVGTPALIVGRTIIQGAITRAQLESLIDDESRQPDPGPC